MLLVLSIAFAAGCVDNLLVFMESDLGISLGAVIMFTLLIIVFAYMGAKVTNNPALTVFYKDELFHLFFSVLLLVGISAILFFSCSLTSSFLDYSLKETGATKCYSGQESPQSIALCTIKNLEKEAQKTVKKAVQKSIDYEMASTFSVTIYNPATGAHTIPTGAYKKTYATQIDIVVMTYVVPALISLTMQKLLVSFAVDFVTYLLPIAFLFRIFPPTRQMGNLLIAVSIALYVIIPTMYGLNAAMDEVIFGSAACDDGEVDLGSGLSLDIYDGVLGGCDNEYSFWNVARLLPQAFFLPNLTFALVVTCLSAINKALRVLG